MPAMAGIGMPIKGAKTLPPGERFWVYVNKTDTCWLWTGGTRGYGYGVFSVDNRGIAAHRYAFELAAGRKLRTGECVCHRCDTPPCVRPDHLFVGTHRENMRDSIAKGRFPLAMRGSANSNSRLTEHDVANIHAARLGGEGCALIAKRYGVSRTLIKYIVGGRVWTHVPRLNGVAK